MLERAHEQGREGHVVAAEKELCVLVQLLEDPHQGWLGWLLRQWEVPC